MNILDLCLSISFMILICGISQTFTQNSYGLKRPPYCSTCSVNPRIRNYACCFLFFRCCEERKNQTSSLPTTNAPYPRRIETEITDGYQLTTEYYSPDITPGYHTHKDPERWITTESTAKYQPDNELSNPDITSGYRKDIEPEGSITTESTDKYDPNLNVIV